ncbi:LLM class flavin-dependent oxidoreductase [Corynebacterium freneyi]|uniref:Luciferase family oxidoreductase group 1 n=1 Tax=Corynebacterium freneyi TaxID=134034 RepID=A0ABS4U438_9CORY|nr:luciferase family oxidoreductase group 1 [Corynebacterium freneyi]WJZ06453.1 Alkanal monooxygenase alpha chain [Corynebacterium freneyi]
MTVGGGGAIRGVVYNEGMSRSRPPLSVLDLVPVSAGSTAAEAIAATVEAARAAETSGYKRFWVAEHHNTLNIASSATTVLMGHIAGATSTIRVGSGGIMLPNHAPLRVAEDVGTLATIYPDRIDLGLGRAPGTDPSTARELRRGASDVVDFAADIRDLVRYLGPVRPEAKIVAYPGQGTNVPMYVLGSTTAGASVAAVLGMPFAIASHFAPHQLAEALEVYRDSFNADAPTATIAEPHVMVAANVLVADTAERARREFSVIQQMFLSLGRGGARKPLPQPVDHPEAGATMLEWQRVQTMLRCSFHGTADDVTAGLDQFAADTGADEIITVTYSHDPSVRIDSIRRLGEAWLT